MAIVLHGEAGLQSFWSEPAATSTKRSPFAATVTVTLLVAEPPGVRRGEREGRRGRDVDDDAAAVAADRADAVIDRERARAARRPGQRDVAAARGHAVGVAEKLVIVGAGGGATVTVTDALPVPDGLVPVIVKVVVEVMCAVAPAEPVTLPMPWSMASVSEKLAAVSAGVVQVRCTSPPPAGSVAGVATKLVIAGVWALNCCPTDALLPAAS